MQLNRTQQVIGASAVGGAATFLSVALTAGVLVFVLPGDEPRDSEDVLVYIVLCIIYAIIGFLIGVIAGLIKRGILISALTGLLITTFAVTLVVMLAVVSIWLEEGGINPTFPGRDDALDMTKAIAFLISHGVIGGLASGIFIKKTTLEKQPETFELPPSPPLEF